MVVLTNIQIADVNLTITCRDSITLHKHPKEYEHFIKKPYSENGPTSININLDFNNIPSTENLKKIFDSQSWSMFVNGDEYFIALSPPVLENKAVWIAHFNRNFKEINVYCSEQLIHKCNGKTKVSNPVYYPLDQILLMYFLAQREGALIHAAGAEFNCKGYIFAGKSGAGKSTLTRQFAYIDGLSLFSDDRIVVRKTENNFKAFGTPWPGEAGIALNKSVNLSGIFLISQASFNRIEEIKTQKAMERLLPVVSIPWYDKEIMISILDFCGDLVSNIPAYELHFKPGNEVIDVFKKFILG